jgi:hypothetical protein
LIVIIVQSKCFFFLMYFKSLCECYIIFLFPCDSLRWEFFFLYYTLLYRRINLCYCIHYLINVHSTKNKFLLKHSSSFFKDYIYIYNTWKLNQGRCVEVTRQPFKINLEIQCKYLIIFVLVLRVLSLPTWIQDKPVKRV